MFFNRKLSVLFSMNLDQQQLYIRLLTLFKKQFSLHPWEE